MIIAESVREYGGNGLCGLCTVCEELVPILPGNGKRDRCMNHGGDTPAVVRTTVGSKWTRTKQHRLVELPGGDAFCRACRTVVTPYVWGRSLRCPSAVKTPRGAAKAPAREPWVRAECRGCGKTFRSVGLFDAHLTAEGHCPDRQDD